MRTAQMPDTVFLPDRARLAIDCLLGCLNPEKGQLPCRLTDPAGTPPRMAHTQFDYSDHTARVTGALLLARARLGPQGVRQGAQLRHRLETGGDPACSRRDVLVRVPEWVLDTEYVAHRRGDTLTRLTPEGTRMPLYRRGDGAGTVAMREMSVPPIGFLV